MTGDQADMQDRLRRVLPAGWFTAPTPVLDALLAGLGAGWEAIYGQIAYVRAQARLLTATGDWLDAKVQDYLSPRFRRRVNEADAAFAARAGAEIIRPRVTRAALTNALTLLTGRAPVIFEPANPTDTGGYGVAQGYRVAGGYGSLLLPGQVFVTAYRPTGAGITKVGGWRSGAGGYGVGAIRWADLSEMGGGVLDAEIDQTIADTLPAGGIAWTRITSGPVVKPSSHAPLGQFILGSNTLGSA